MIIQSTLRPFQHIPPDTRNSSYSNYKTRYLYVNQYFHKSKLFDDNKNCERFYEIFNSILIVSGALKIFGS